MQVCFVTHRYPPQTGGVETHVRAVAVRLAERGHEVTVVSADRGVGGYPKELRDGVHVRRVRALAPGGAIHLAPGVCSTLRREASEADVVHVHNYHSLPFTFGALCAPDTRLVATPHYHGESDDPLRDRLLSLMHPAGSRALGRADSVIAVSEWERERLRESFGVEPRVIPNGVVRERFADATPNDPAEVGNDPAEVGNDPAEARNDTNATPNETTEVGNETTEADGGSNKANADRPYLLCVGRLARYKGVDDAIRALAVLPDYELHVAGSGPDRERLERLAGEVGVADRVRFLGYVDDDRLPGLYAGAAAHLQLSTHEAYGLTVAESIAAGTPVVVRPTRALAEWTRHEGVTGVDTHHDGDTGGDEPTTQSIRRAVTTAVEGTAPDPTSVPTWDEVTDRLLAVYRGR